MSNKSSHHHAADEQNDVPRTRPIHHSPVFWIGVVLVIAAMLTYVFTMDLATRPVPGPKQPTPAAIH